MHAVTERFVRRSAAPAQCERPTRNLIGVPVPIDECHVVALDQIWPVLSHPDVRHRSRVIVRRSWPIRQRQLGRDLVYLDLPFNSNASFNVLFAEKSGKQAAAQIKAFGFLI
jgi:hypothetical protein